MKKYMNLFILSIFIVIMVGYFYIENSKTSNLFPNFKIEKISGNDDAIKDMIITGELHYNYYGFDSFRITPEETKYFRDEPFLTRVNRYYKQINVESLQKEYRNFMRGKDEFIGSFYETDDVLVYGSTTYDSWSIDSEKFDIALLDKQTNDIISFQVPIPNRNEYWYIDTREIYLTENELLLITVNHIGTANDEIGEVHIYTFDIKEKKLLNDEIIEEIQYENIGHGNKNVDVLLDEKNEEVLVYKSVVQYTEDPHSLNDTAKIENVVKYNLKTKEKEFVHEELDQGIPIALIDDKLYLAQNQERKLKLTQYDLEKDKVMDQLEIDILNVDFSIEELNEPLVKNGKFYFVPVMVDGNMECTISVVDLINFEVEYNGKIDIAEPLKLQEVAIYFSEIELIR